MTDAIGRKKYDLDRTVRLVLTCASVGLGVFLINYLSSILLPFVVGCLLAYMLEPVVRFFMRVFHLKNRMFPALLTMTLFFGALFLACWFLKSIFLCFVFYYPYAKYKNVYVLFFTIVLSLFVVYYKFNEMYICFLFGTFLREFERLVYRKIRLVSFLSATVFLFLFCFWNNEYLKIYYEHLGPFVLFDTSSSLTHYFSVLFYKIIIGLCGSVFLFCLFKMRSSLFQSSKLGRYISYMGKNTLYIYVFQYFFLETVLGVFLDLDNLDKYFTDLVLTPILSLIILVFMNYLYVKIGKSFAMTFVFGR